MSANLVEASGPDETGTVRLSVNGEVVAWAMRPEWATGK